MADHDNDFWDFVAFWEFFNPFKDKKREETKPTSRTIKKVYDINSLIRDMGNENANVADSAQETLERLGEVAISLLVQALGNEKLSIRRRATWALIHSGKVVVSPVIEALKNENPEVRFYAAGVLQMLRDERSIEPLIKVMKEDNNKRVRNAASFALHAIKDPRVKESLRQYGKENSISFLFDDEPQVAIQKEPKESSLYEWRFETVKKDFYEKLFPVLKEGHGLTWDELFKAGFTFDTVNWLEKLGMIKRKRVGRTTMFFMPIEITNIEKRKFLLKAGDEKAKIEIESVLDRNTIIFSYFDKEILRELFKDYYNARRWEEEKNHYRNMKKSGWIIDRNKKQKEFLFSEEEDTSCVDSFLDYIGECIVFEVNEDLRNIINKYWTEKCDEEIKVFYNKYGFFSDSVFTFIDLLKKSIGEDKLNDFYSELEEKAPNFRIASVTSYTTTNSNYIPLLYARHLKFKWGIKPEIWYKNCMLCGQMFNPFYLLAPAAFPYLKNWEYATYKIPEFVIKCYPIENSIKEVNFCPIHLLKIPSRDIYNEYLASKDNSVRDNIKNKMGVLLKRMTDILGFIPERNFHESLSYLQDLDKQKFEEILKLLNKMPSYDYGYKEIFGSWLQALDAAGILEGGVRKTSRGYICLAKDGHVCRSIGEKIIDDYLFTHNISHEQEPHYPGERQFRADWKVGKYFIEFWGLKGEEDYDKRMEDKKALAQQQQIPLIEISCDDLRHLELKFKDILGAVG